jgi:hypothetical protein
MSNSGKGSKRRPTDQQKFEDNFDKILECNSKKNGEKKSLTNGKKKV